MVQVISETAILAAIEINSETIIRLSGRLHPMLVHFPIALVFAAAAFEFLRLPGTRRRAMERWRAWSGRDEAPVYRQVCPAAVGCLVLAGVSAVAAAMTGWINADMELVGPQVTWHRWAGIVAAGLIVLTGIAGVIARVPSRVLTIYQSMLLVSCVGVGLSGHLGAQMVYGEGYLRDALKMPVTGPNLSDDERSDSGQPLTLNADVEQIFADHCYECHSNRRAKAGLNLALMNGILNSGVIIPGDPERSPLIQRVSVAAVDPDRMPPEGVMLNSEQIEMLSDWIAQAGRLDGESADLEKSTGDLAAMAAAMQRINERGGFAGFVAEGDDRVVVDLRRMEAFSDTDFELLNGLQSHVIDLNLAGSKITDASLRRLAEYEALERLHLQNSPISDVGIKELAGLERLSYLNLYGVSLSDDSIDALSAMPALRSVYLWQTGVSSEGVEALQLRRKGLNVVWSPSVEHEQHPDVGE